MKLSLRQQFSFPADVVAAGFTDPGLYPWFAKLPKVGVPEVLTRVVEGSRVRMRIRYRFGGDLSPAARALIDPSKLTWVDESVHDLDTCTVTFELHPDAYGERFRCRGRYSFTDTPSGCERSAEIDLKVSFPVVGRAVENAIASGLREHLDDEVVIIEQYLRAKAA